VALTGHHRLPTHWNSHSVGVHLSVAIRLGNLGHESAMETLLLRDRAVLMCKQQGLEAYDLLPQLRDLGGQGIVLRAEHLNLRLEVGQPLLLALATFEGGNTVKC
jgi:hypothetical protein